MTIDETESANDFQLLYIQNKNTSIGNIRKVLVLRTVPERFYIGHWSLSDLFLYQVAWLSAFDDLELD
jgi:hypothetical protein